MDINELYQVDYLFDTTYLVMAKLFNKGYQKKVMEECKDKFIQTILIVDTFTPKTPHSHCRHRRISCSKTKRNISDNQTKAHFGKSKYITEYPKPEPIFSKNIRTLS